MHAVDGVSIVIFGQNRDKMPEIVKMKFIFAVLFSISFASIRKCYAQFSFDFVMQSPIVDTVEFNSEYDFIVIGAGSGGCVMANRLTENANWTVLLLEVGQEETDVLTDVPLTAAMTVLTRKNVYSFIFIFLITILEL